MKIGSVYWAFIISLSLHILLVWHLTSAPETHYPEGRPIEIFLINSTEFDRMLQAAHVTNNLNRGELRNGVSPSETSQLPLEVAVDTKANGRISPPSLEVVPLEAPEVLKTLPVEETLEAHYGGVGKKEYFGLESIAAVSKDIDDTHVGLDRSLTISQQKGSAHQVGDLAVSAREAAAVASAIADQLNGCWNALRREQSIEAGIVTLRWQLNSDGSLDGEPRVIGRRLGVASESAADDAIRAVKQCQPFQLDPNQYHVWKTIVWDFSCRTELP